MAGKPNWMNKGKAFKSYIEDTEIGLDLDLDEIEEKYGISLKQSTKKTRAEDYTWLFHGPPKIGKTTLAHSMINLISNKHPWFFRFEEGTKGISNYGCSVVSWEGFKGQLRNMWKLKRDKKKKFPFNFFICDTVDLMFKMCHAYIAKRHHIAHASDLEWGKGWEFLVDEFAKVYTFMHKFQVGLIFISHSKETEFKTRTMSVHKWQPTLTGTGRRIILPAIDIIGFCTYDVVQDVTEVEKFKARRVIRWEPSEEWEAGDRSGFLPKKTRLNPVSVLRYFPGNEQMVEAYRKDQKFMEYVKGLK